MISRVDVALAGRKPDAPCPTPSVGPATAPQTRILQPGRKIPSVAGAASTSPSRKQRVPGRFAGTFTILDGFFDPLSPEEAGSVDR